MRGALAVFLPLGLLSAGLLAACASGKTDNVDDPDAALPVGDCSDGQNRCDGLTIQTCDDGVWIDGGACQFSCTAGVCGGACEPGTVLDCYGGPTGTEDVGICTGGTTTCSAGGVAGACVGEVRPEVEEDCGTPGDDDCDDEINEGCCTATADLLLDSSFEVIGAGGAGAPWTVASTQFGTPLCSDASCNPDLGTGPITGAWWVWFGGTPGLEDGEVTQSVTIPAGDVAMLRFNLELPTCAPSAADFMKVTVDGTQVFQVLGNDASCGVVGYALKTIDLSAYADGAAHEISFLSRTNNATGAITSFFVENVDLDVTCTP